MVVTGLKCSEFGKNRISSGRFSLANDFNRMQMWPELSGLTKLVNFDMSLVNIFC